MTHDGTHSGYVKGCRCDKCTAANRTYMRQYRRRERRGDQLMPAVTMDPMVHPDTITLAEYHRHANGAGFA